MRMDFLIGEKHMVNNRIAYGIAKLYGIDTTDMDPEQAWEAIKEKIIIGWVCI